MAAKQKSTPEQAARRRNSRVTTDPLDFRDCLYSPPVRDRPPAVLLPAKTIPVLDQDDTNACTGFALAAIVHWLLGIDAQAAPRERVSPFMLYSMARRYDEYPGAKEDSGSSLRGALKGWHKHGACRLDRWPGLDMPDVPEDPKQDWWGDAVRRPLGAYYRIDPEDMAAMHVALAEVGIVFASVVAHAEWDEGHGVRSTRAAYWEIPHRRVGPRDGGHAVAIIGYSRLCRARPGAPRTAGSTRTARRCEASSRASKPQNSLKGGALPVNSNHLLEVDALEAVRLVAANNDGQRIECANSD